MDSQFDLVGLTENLVNNLRCGCPALATPEGYKILDHPRVSRSTGGGTGLLFRDTLCVSKLSSGKKSSLMSFLNLAQVDSVW